MYPQWSIRLVTSAICAAGVENRRVRKASRSATAYESTDGLNQVSHRYATCLIPLIASGFYGTMKDDDAVCGPEPLSR